MTSCQLLQLAYSV